MPKRVNLSDEIIVEMEKLRAGGWTYRSLSERFGVSSMTLRRVITPGFRENQRNSRLGMRDEVGNLHLVRVTKRPYTGVCELCGKSPLRLDWHHWDNSHPEHGMWLCYGQCHIFAEKVELGLVEKYKELKEWSVLHSSRIKE